MEKEKADALLKNYLPKIYGFAYKKTFSYNEAEDLASEMTLEVYNSLLAQSEIINVDGYIWRICEHTYAKFVDKVRRRPGLSIDEIANIPYFDRYANDAASEEKRILRREIAFLSSQRRRIVYQFYYQGKSIRSIAGNLHLPEGTVKWHLNRARNELKEGMTMKRQIGTLGLHPVKATSFGHSGMPSPKGATEYFLSDALQLNIVFSVYFEPKSAAEIAEELGLTLVFIEDKIAFLENNGYLIPTKDGKYTTYVRFSPRTFYREQEDQERKRKWEAAQILVKEYVPLVQKAVADVKCFIPGGNRQLLEAAAIFYAVENCCRIPSGKSSEDLEKYQICDLNGGKYIAHVSLESECADPDYKMQFPKEYGGCGDMWRGSDKYPTVSSWAMDTRLDTRKGAWPNNLYTDYEAMYEYIQGKLNDRKVHSDKLNRLKDREFIDAEGNVQIMICQGKSTDFFNRLPALDEKWKKRFAEVALENAIQAAKQFPPQMQDLIMVENCGFFDSTVALMVMDILYEEGIFRPLTEKERVTANLLMFSDILPEE